MGPLAITLISVAASLLLLFLLFLFLIKPRKRRAAVEEFKECRFAHRGLHGEGAAENSLTAFRLAVEAGYGIELDVRLSSDGELVVFHDDTLTRVTGICGRVDEKTKDELSKIKLSGTEDTVPTFAEVLSLVGGRVPLLVELKEDAGKYGVTEKAVEMLSEYEGKYLIESFNPLALARVKKLMPNAPRGILSETFFKEKKYRNPLYFLLQNLLLNVVSRPDFVAFRHTDSGCAALRAVRAFFKPVTFAWTVESQKEEDAAKKHGFDGVIFEGYMPEK
jgi:glycerophosphoryl diester phosphodiesterase